MRTCTLCAWKELCSLRLSSKRLLNRPPHRLLVHPILALSAQHEEGNAMQRHPHQSTRTTLLWAPRRYTEPQNETNHVYCNHSNYIYICVSHSGAGLNARPFAARCPSCPLGHRPPLINAAGRRQGSDSQLPKNLLVFQHLNLATSQKAVKREHVAALLRESINQHKLMRNPTDLSGGL